MRLLRKILAVCLVLLCTGCGAGKEKAGGASLADTLRVLVHEGGPRFAAAKPELLPVTLMGSKGKVMVGRILNPPQRIRSVTAGDTIRFMAVDNYSHAILVTDRYLVERRHSYVIPCKACGFSELFDCPSDLARSTFPGQQVSTFTTRCPMCGGAQVVRLLPPMPGTARDASEKEVTAAVVSVVAGHLGKERSSIALDRPLSAQGADELDLVELVFALEEHFVVRIPDSRIGDYSTLTVGDLIRVARQSVSERRDDEPLFGSD